MDSSFAMNQFNLRSSRSSFSVDASIADLNQQQEPSVVAASDCSISTAVSQEDLVNVSISGVPFKVYSHVFDRLSNLPWKFDDTQGVPELSTGPHLFEILVHHASLPESVLPNVRNLNRNDLEELKLLSMVLEWKHMQEYLEGKALNKKNVFPKRGVKNLAHTSPSPKGSQRRSKRGMNLFQWVERKGGWNKAKSEPAVDAYGCNILH